MSADDHFGWVNVVIILFIDRGIAKRDRNNRVRKGNAFGPPAGGARGTDDKHASDGQLSGAPGGGRGRGREGKGREALPARGAMLLMGDEAAGMLMTLQVPLAGGGRDAVGAGCRGDS